MSATSATSPESTRGRNLTEAMGHLAAANSALNSIDLRHGSKDLRELVKLLRAEVGEAADHCNEAIQFHLRESAAGAA